jgi:Fe-S cluster assembly protein SufD
MAVRTAEARRHYLAEYERLKQHRAEPAWLAELRDGAAARFAELGFPTTRLEDWKYTDVTRVVEGEYRAPDGQSVEAGAAEAHYVDEAARCRLAFVDGRFSPELSTLDALPRGVVVTDLAGAVTTDGARILERLGSLAGTAAGAFAALNTALWEAGALVEIPEGRAVEQTIHLLYLSGAGDRPVLASPRTLVVAGAGSVARIVESFASVGDGEVLTNAVAEISLGDGAVVEHYRVQNESRESAVHVGSTDVRVGRGATYTSVAVALGSRLSRHDLRVELAAEGASCSIDGLYAVDGARHCDNHTAIRHAVPHTGSTQLYKGVLSDSARAVFNGRVVVERNAQKAEAHQTNRNLLLSGGPRVDTKPELEIYTDDVVCTHGATVGALDDEERFYLASRGLDPDTARGLLTYGFAEEIIAEIKTESLRRQLDAVILDRVGGGSAIG